MCEGYKTPTSFGKPGNARPNNAESRHLNAARPAIGIPHMRTAHPTPRSHSPMTTRIRLQPITDQDLPFLHRVYAGTRTGEMRMVPWSEEEKASFLQMQFTAQHQYYRKHYGDAAFDLILLDDEPVGRLYVQRNEREIILIDLALLPEYRKRGIGGNLLRDLLEEASAARKPIRLHVEHENPAHTWYRKLGFRDLEDRGVYIFMEWAPGPTV